ncbi:MAG TPA: GAF domain-containing protein [Armatimonadota bacterium]|jgi:GAF domain-containing protein
MGESIGRLQDQHERLKQLLTADTAGLAAAWLATGTLSQPDDGISSQDLLAQAMAFLTLLAAGMPSQEPAAGASIPDDMAWRQYFPLVYRVSALLALAKLLAVHLAARGETALADDTVLTMLLAGLAACSPYPPRPHHLFSERLAHLSHVAWTLNTQDDQDAIMQLAIEEAAALVGADSGAIWLWDIDQHAPLMVVTADAHTMAPEPPPALLQLLRQVCERGCAFSIDAGESEASWPDLLRHRPLALVALPAPEGCLGVLSVHHAPGVEFSHDDMLLLSSLGNLTATALRNVQLHANERHLVNLLRTSIRQVVEATANRSDSHDEFVQSLLHVAEGLTRADAVGALFRVGEHPLEVISGALVEQGATQLAVMRRIIAAGGQRDFPRAGAVAEVLADAPHDVPAYYALAEITLEGKRSGVVVALSRAAVTEEQVAFLCTIAEQIGVGVDNRQQSANLQRLLFELSNVNYVSETITSTFDPQRIFATISQAASQALNAPIALCGWMEDDGSLRIWPDTAVGIPATDAATLSLTYNNAVIRQVLDGRKEVNSRAVDRRASPAIKLFRALQVKDWVCVPMMVKPRARGIMLVADVRPRQFSRREIALLSTYANQAALAMENSLLYEQVDRQLQQMDQLYQVTRSVSSTLDLTEILQELLRAATTSLDVPVGVIALADEGTTVQQVVASSGIDPAHLSSVQIDAGEGILGVAAQRNETIISSNLARDGRSPLLRGLAREEHLVSSLTVPVEVQQRVLGTLTVIARESREFTPAHVQLLRAMATEAAVAVRNARLYAQERTRAQELRVLVGEVADRVSTTLDILTELLEIAHQTEPGTVGVERTQQRLASVAAVQASITEDDPISVDVKEAMTRLAHERALCTPDGSCRLDIRVTGARLILPSRLATALALFIHEWLLSAIAVVMQQPDTSIVIAFQQIGREVLVQIDDTAVWDTAQVSVNSAIIALVTRIVPGVVSETTEEGIHRVRFRFTRPNRP